MAIARGGSAPWVGSSLPPHPLLLVHRPPCSLTNRPNPPVSLRAHLGHGVGLALGGGDLEGLLGVAHHQQQRRVHAQRLLRRREEAGKGRGGWGRVGT